MLMHVVQITKLLHLVREAAKKVFLLQIAVKALILSLMAFAVGKKPRKKVFFP